MTHKYGFEQADTIAARMDGVPYQLLTQFIEQYMAERRQKFNNTHGLTHPMPSKEAQP